MATLDSFAETPGGQNELTEHSENHSPEWGAPPLAPTEATAPRHAELVARKPAGYAGEHNLLYGSEEDDLINGPEQANLSGNSRTFPLPRKLGAGIAIIGALGVCAYAYFFSGSATDNTAAQRAQVSPAAPATVQPAPGSSVQTAINASESSAEPIGTESVSSRTEALPAEQVDANGKAQPMEASQNVRATEASEAVEPAAVSQKMVSATSPARNEPRISLPAVTADVLFLQRPGVNIRSTPSKTGTAVGSAPKGTRFKVLSREADWIQVQNGRLKGWINAQFLAPTQPQ